MDKKMKESKRNVSPFLPKFQAVKNTYEIFNNRIIAISADSGFQKNVHRLKYFQKMEKLRENVNRLLKSYPGYEPEAKKRDPSKAFIPTELEKKLKTLATPPKRSVKETLIIINHLIRNIMEDHQYQKNKHKLKRLCDLLRYRNQVCCQFSKYSKSPSNSDCCFKFRPCSTKSTAVYAVYDCEKKPMRKFKSRVLKFKFDKETNELALPSYHRIKAALEFYTNMCNQLHYQLTIDKLSQVQKEKVDNLLCGVINHINVLATLQTEAELRMKPQKDQNCLSEENKRSLTTFCDRYPNAESRICYGLPIRRKLKEALKTQQDLFKKICEAPERSKLIPHITGLN
jgi:hypothetical protein